MKRSRAKAVGLSLTLLAGPVHAADGPWHAGPPGAAPVVIAEPVRGPVVPRVAQWGPAGGDGESAAVWLPARKPVAPVVPPAAPASGVRQAGGFPALLPPVEPFSPEADPIGPRLGAASPVGGPLPAIPPLPDADLAATVPPAPPVSQPPAPFVPVTPAEPRDAFPARPVAIPNAPDPAPTLPLVRPAAVPPITMPETPRPTPPAAVAASRDPWRPVGDVSIPRAPITIQPPADPIPPPRLIPPMTDPKTPVLPKPKAVPPAASGELPTAPPALMRPIGVPVPGNRGTFGSPPIRISKDYPGLSDLIHQGHPGLGTDPGAPATDRLSFQAEYLLWWVRSAQVPALATTSVAPNPDRTTLLGKGFLGDPSTRLLLGPGGIGGSNRSGLRLRAGLWFDDCGTCGIDGSFFFLGNRSTTNVFDSAAVPVITRPFFAPNLNAEFGETVAFPNFSSGTLTIQNRSSLWGADVNLRHAVCKTCGFRSEWFGGYRFLSLSEQLQMTESILALPGIVNDPTATDPPGTRTVVQDQFGTKNWFHGGQLGYAAERRWGWLSVDVRASVALGVTHQQLDIAGSQVKLLPGAAAPTAFNGGLLAVGPNLGRFTADRFAVVPEATVNLGYWFTPHLKAYIGYNFLYWSNVIRPGDQIDRVVDVAFVPNAPPGVVPTGVNRPQPLFRQSNLWIQGIQFGLMTRW